MKLRKPSEVEYRKRLGQATRLLRSVLGKSKPVDETAIDKAVSRVYNKQHRFISTKFIDRPATTRQKIAIRNSAAHLRRFIRALGRVPFFISDMFDEETLRKRLAELDALKSVKLERKGRQAPDLSLAAEQAAGLLKLHEIPLTTTPGGTFDELAAILSGNPRAEMRNYISAVAKKLSTVRE